MKALFDFEQTNLGQAARARVAEHRARRAEMRAQMLRDIALRDRRNIAEDEEGPAPNE